jgi:FkbM family methyltransferase
MGLRQWTARSIRSGLEAMAGLLGLKRASRWSCGIAETVMPVSEIGLQGGRSLKLYCPNGVTYWRARTFHSKEPETLAWIEGFRAGESLLDVGANVGLYTLYAAIRGHRVLALEPESQNLALLNRNILLNRVQDLACALGIGLDSTSHQGLLRLSKAGAGEALHTVVADERQGGDTGTLQQGLIALSLDDLLGKYTRFFPNHVKIDVDGTEGRIIEGGKQTLHDARLRSILIELNEDLPADREIARILQGYGFGIERRAHATMFDSGPYSMIYNYIFSRP